MPERRNGMWAMNLFRSHYRDIVIEALEQAEKVRKEGKTAREIYPANAITVDLGGQQWGVEIFVAYSAELIEGFKNVSEARAWIRNEADNYLVGKGLPKGTKVKVIE